MHHSLLKAQYTMMGKIEASIYPDAIFADFLVVLWANWPVAWLRDVVGVTHLDALSSTPINDAEDSSQVDY